MHNLIDFFICIHSWSAGRSRSNNISISPEASLIPLPSQYHLPREFWCYQAVLCLSWLWPFWNVSKSFCFKVKRCCKQPRFTPQTHWDWPSLLYTNWLLHWGRGRWPLHNASTHKFLMIKVVPTFCDHTLNRSLMKESNGLPFGGWSPCRRSAKGSCPSWNDWDCVSSSAIALAPSFLWCSDPRWLL